MRILATLAVATLAFCACFASAQDAAKGPKITNKVFFDVEVDGKVSSMLENLF